jgi:hypothetical protein
MSGLGASADCPAPIIAGSAVSICEPLINGSPVSVIYSAARCGTTNYSLNDTVLRLADILLLGLTGAASVVLTALALRFAFVVGPRQWVEAGAAASAFAGSVLVAITMLQYLVLALTLWMLLRALRRSWATRRTE